LEKEREREWEQSLQQDQVGVGGPGA
jgi:hypothetical protein